MNSRTKVYLALVLTVLMMSVACQSQPSHLPCRQIQESTRLRVAAYVMAKYNIPSQASFTLTSIDRVAQTCFQAFSYSITGRTSPLVVYLDPDQSYISPSLWDLSTDPIAEERVRHQKLQDAMVQGIVHQNGPTNALVTIIEFSDFQCPFCRKEAEVLRALAPEFTASGVRVIYRNFPLPMHRWAMDAARMATCASKQDEQFFWLTHDFFFFSNQASLTADNLQEKVNSMLSSQANFDHEEFESCVAQHQTDQEIQGDSALGKANGVVGTPTLFINGVLVRGAKSADDLRLLIDAAKQQKRNGTSTRAAAVTPKEQLR